MNTSSPIVCPSCGYITADDVPTCPRCDAPMPRVDGWAAPTAETDQPPYHGGAPRPARPPLPHERSPYARPAPSRRRRNYAVPIAVAVGAIVVALAAFVLGVVPKLAAGIGGLVEDTKTKVELEEALLAQPDFTAQYDAVEGDLTYSGTLCRRGDDIAVKMHYPRALLTGDPAREGKTEVAIILPSEGAATVMVPEMQRYVKLEPGSSEFPDNWFARITMIVAEPACQVSRAPSVTVNNVPCKVYALSASNRTPGSAYVFVAEEPKGVVMKIELASEWTAVGDLKLTLRNPKLAVDEDLFRIPVTYSEMSSAE